jgi:hypothetical protein
MLSVFGRAQEEQGERPERNIDLPERGELQVESIPAENERHDGYFLSDGHLVAM